MNTDFSEHNGYFGAANSYQGFRSFFPLIFKRDNFSKAFILKGGPGTGKSTLMRNILNKNSDKCVECEKIWCSSDAKSLDGIILKGQNGSVAVIDGTAPHTTEAECPPIKDEIINLGDFWSVKKISESKEEIQRLAAEKKSCYDNAYKRLRIAGILNEYLKEYRASSYIKDRREILRIVTENTKGSDFSICEKRFLSAFGKDGYITLNPSNIKYNRLVKVLGVYGSENMFLEELLYASRLYGADVTVFPSPLDPSTVEALYFRESSTLYSTLFDSDEKIDTEKYVDMKVIDKNLENINLFSKAVSVWEKEAEVSFKKASEYHFALEKIYTPCMDFEGIQRLTEELSSAIEKIL